MRCTGVGAASQSTESNPRRFDSERKTGEMDVKPVAKGVAFGELRNGMRPV